MRGGTIGLFFLALSACGGGADLECEDGMRDPLNRWNDPSHWGGAQSKPVTTKWGQNQQLDVLSKPPYRMGVDGRLVYCVPQSQSVLLKFKQQQNPNDTAVNWAFRWILSVGAGGARADIKFDALNTQQLAVAGEDLRATLICEQAQPDDAANGIVNAWEFPLVGIDASATFADGNVSSNAATYTQLFRIPAGSTQVFAIPQMATGWRILGTAGGAAGTPFQANMNYIVQGFGQSITGDLLSNKDPFLALSGLAKGFRISNTTAALVTGLLQWGLDL